MKTIRSILFLCLLFATLSASAQFGIRTKYNVNSFASWDDFLETATPQIQTDIFKNNIEVGVDYWFRLKNYRVEFLPELYVTLPSTTPLTTDTEANFSALGFNFNTQLYIFDLTGDCDCPTFSKQGPSLKKGFFVNLAPGIFYNTKEITSPLTGSSSMHVNFKLGAGVGYDIGISDLFTITPMISYNYAPSMTFNDLGTFFTTEPANNPNTSDLTQVQFQIRFGFRPDYVKSYGRRR